MTIPKLGLAALICLFSGLPATPNWPPAGQDDDPLEVLYRAMRAADTGRLDGIAYSLSRDNALDTNWLAQTPNAWGMRAGAVPRGAGRFMVQNVKTLVEGAQRFVDITSLNPFPDGQFQTAIQEGLVALAKSGRPVTVRILVGWAIVSTPGQPNQSEYLDALIGPLKRIRDGKLTIYVGAQRNGPKSWNHAKILAVDGERALTGGENLWDRNYLQFQPVHDLNVSLRGSVAFGMHQFADRLWANVCDYRMDSWKSANWKTGMSEVRTGCLAHHGMSRTPGPGNVAVLGAGRLAGLDGNGNAADVGMVAAFEGAKSTIRISQQDLGFPPNLWWKPGMTALAKALVARRDVYIVLTNDGAKAGPDGTGYTTHVGIAATAREIKSYVASQPGAPSGAELVDLLCSKLHLTTLRFGPSEHWPNGYQFANHAKFFMVDDRVFYVGSENLYPSDLAEYGVFIADSGAVRQMKAQYWDQLWRYSSRVAISGTEAKDCYFRR